MKYQPAYDGARVGRWIGILAIVTAFACLGCSNPTAPTSETLKQEDDGQLPAELIGQFERLGGKYGHFVINQDGRFEVNADGDLVFTLARDKPAVRGLPGFRFEKAMDDAAAAKLPRFDRVLGLQILGGGITDAGVKELLKLEGLTVLSLCGCEAVGDQYLGHLANAKRLEALDLFNTNVPDAELKKLVSLKRLRFLNLSCTQVGVAGLRELVRVESLQELHLTSCKNVTPAGVRELATLKELRILNLSCCPKLGSVSFLEPSGFEQLRVLRLGLSRAELDDGQLKRLIKLKQLRELDVDLGPNVTDQGLSELGKLTRLRKLQLNGRSNTKVSAAAVRQLQSALPDCEVKLGQFLVPSDPAREPAAVEAAVAKLQTLTLEKNGFVLIMGAPGFAVQHTDETRAVVAKGSAAVPHLLARLDLADYDETAFIVFCLRELRAKSAKAKILDLQKAVAEKRRFQSVRNHIGLDRELYQYLHDFESWK